MLPEERDLALLWDMREAASHVSDIFREKHPEFPWTGIIGQRNVLAHEYGEILVDRIWLVAKERLPDLVRLINALIPPPTEPMK